MNIVFFTQEDPFYVKIFFDEFFAKYEKLDEIKAFVVSRPMGKKSTKKLAKQMYNFYGPLDFFKVGLRYAYIKIMSRKTLSRKPGETVNTYSVRQLAESYGLNVLERSDLNNPDFHKILRSYEPDLCISVASPIIFKEQLIKIPRLDTINIHNAPLPKYRGMLPNFWQLYHDEKQAGMTIHRIDTGIDTGDKLLQYFTPIESGDSLDDLIVKTKRAGALQMIKVIEEFRKGNVCYSKIEGEGSYFSFPSRADVAEFKRRGKRLL